MYSECITDSIVYLALFTIAVTKYPGDEVGEGLIKINPLPGRVVLVVYVSWLEKGQMLYLFENERDAH